MMSVAMDEMRPLRSLVSFEEARRVILEAARPIEETEAVPLLEAGGRVLARDVVAEIDVPGFDRAAMDGYAVRAADTFGAGRFAPAKLRRAGVVHAGEVPARAVQAGECLEIATGAVLPEGADGVVKVEDTEREGDEVSVLAPIHPGEHVSRKGEDIRAGATILRRGDVLTPAKVGAAAALGRPALDVFRRATRSSSWASRSAPAGSTT
jgi:molybdopterin molybdotransferase